MNPVELKSVFLIAVTVPAQLVFAKNDLDRAQLIYPQGNDLPGGQTFQCILCRMAVPVVFSAGDYAEAGPDVCKEMRRRRGFRSVMTDFQHVCLA